MSRANKITIFYFILAIFGEAFFHGASPVRGTNTSIFTISAWVKPSSSAASKAILGKAEELRVATNASGQPICQIKSSSSWQTAAISSVAVSVGSWSHVACTYDLAYVRIFVNGVEKGSQALAVAADDTAAVWKIGRDDSGSTPYGYFAGQIDEFKFYNSALTPEQVALDMNQGKSLQLGGQNANNNGTAVTGASAEYCVPGDTAQCDPPVGEWKFDEKTGGSVNDTSGNDNIGTWNGTGTHWTRGKFGSAGSFNGSDDYIGIGGTASSVKTVSFWIKPSNTNQYIMDLDNGTHYIWMNSGTLTASGSSTPTVYIDGIQTSTVSNTNWHFVSVTTASGFDASIFTLGKKNTNYFSGLIDQVQIFNYARTPAQIAWDYNRGKPVGHWKFDEGEGASAYDSSGNGNTGTLTLMDPPNDWVTGKFGKALDFDGGDDYVNLGADSKSILSSTQLITLSLWAKSTNSNDRMVALGTYNGAGSNFITIDLNRGSSIPQSNYIFVGFRDSSNKALSAYTTNSHTEVSDGVWHHYVSTFDLANNTIYLYIDGNSVEITYTAQQTPVATTFSRDIFIGALNSIGTPAVYFDGQIDDVRVYNYALTGEQIKQVMNEGSAVRFSE